jgi:hypothetical protein
LAVTVRVAFAPDGGRHRKERDDGDGKCSSHGHPGTAGIDPGCAGTRQHKTPT